MKIILSLVYLFISLIALLGEYTGTDYVVELGYYLFWGINCLIAVPLVNKQLKRLDNH